MVEDIIVVSSLTNIVINIIIGIIAIIIMYQFAKMITTKTFTQINTAFDTNIQSHKAMTHFMETTYKTSTDILSGLLQAMRIQQDMLSDHIKIQEDTTQILTLLEEQNKLIKYQQEDCEQRMDVMEKILNIIREQQTLSQEQHKIIKEQHELLMKQNHIET